MVSFPFFAENFRSASGYFIPESGFHRTKAVCEYFCCISRAFALSFVRKQETRFRAGASKTRFIIPHPSSPPQSAKCTKFFADFRQGRESHDEGDQEMLYPSDKTHSRRTRRGRAADAVPLRGGIVRTEDHQRKDTKEMTNKDNREVKTNEQNEREIEILRKRILDRLHSITDPEELYKIYLLILKAVSEEAQSREA